MHKRYIHILAINVHFLKIFLMPSTSISKKIYFTVIKRNVDSINNEYWEIINQLKRKNKQTVNS